MIDTLLSVVAGAIIGYVGSIAYYWWVQGSEKKELKSRIREELELIREEASSDLKEELFQKRAYAMYVFQGLRTDLIRKLDAKTFRLVQKTYAKIDHLRFPPTGPYALDENKKNYGDVLYAIDETLRFLKNQ